MSNYQKWIAIVGGGLFGRVIGLHLHNLGHWVSIYDAGHKNSGLSAAGCLIKPSWISKIDRREDALNLLDNLASPHGQMIRKVPFTVFNKNVSVDDCYVFDKKRLIKITDSLVTRRCIEDGEDLVRAFDIRIECKGVWDPDVESRWGVSFEYDGLTTDPEIKPWRPYTQLVKFNIDENTVWAGDGTSLKHVEPHRQWECLKRVDRFVGEPPVMPNVIEGFRPMPKRGEKFNPGEPCFLDKLETPKKSNGWHTRWRVNGGGKNGTIAAAWAALKLGEEIGHAPR